MRSKLLLLVCAVSAGCAMSSEAAPKGESGDVVTHLMADRIAADGVTVLPPQNVELTEGDSEGDPPNLYAIGALGRDGTAALAVAGTRGPNAALAVVRFGAGAPQVLTGLSGDRPWLGVAEGAVVAWQEGAADLGIALPGAPRFTLSAAPSGFALQHAGESAAGGLLTVALGADGFDVRRFAVNADGLVELETTLLPAGSATAALGVGDEGDGPWVIGTTGSGLTFSDRAGVIEQPDAGYPLLAFREGDAVFYALTGDTLYRWDLGTNTVSLEEAADAAPEAGWSAAVATDALGVEFTPGPTATWVTHAAGGWKATAIADSPCTLAEACDEVGESSPLAVVNAASGPWVLHQLWSWLGPTGVYATPAVRAGG